MRSKGATIVIRTNAWQPVAWLALASLAAPAPARDLPADADRASLADAVPIVDAPPVRILIGPEHAGGGARFAVRETVAGQAVSVVFSATPSPPQVPAPRAGEAPGVASPARVPTLAPVAAVRMSSGFGLRPHPIEGGTRFHGGVDLAAAWGAPVVATADGTVGAAGWSGGYGLMVAVGHEGGVQTRYGHLSRLAVAPGQAVRQGQVIGYVGSTGQSTGPHVHYEVRVNGVAVDPFARR